MPTHTHTAMAILLPRGAVHGAGHLMLVAWLLWMGWLLWQMPAGARAMPVRIVSGEYRFARPYSPCDVVVCRATHPCQPLRWDLEWCTRATYPMECAPGYEWCALDPARTSRYTLDVPARAGCSCPWYAPCQSRDALRVDMRLRLDERAGYEAVHLVCYAHDDEGVCPMGTTDCGGSSDGEP